MRQDAAHLVYDLGVQHIWQEINEALQEKAQGQQKPFFRFAEATRNDTRFIIPTEKNGLGFDGLWADDFHHALHTLLLPERGGYYADFGKTEDLAKAFQEGFVVENRYSHYRKKKMGHSSAGFSGRHFIAFAQNHDQVGNCPRSSRLASDLPPDALFLVAATYLLSPYVPMLFMGEEYGKTTPFCFFTSFSDTALQEAVRLGRTQEYAEQGLTEGFADPQAADTFLQSKLNWQQLEAENPKALWNWYRQLIALRKTHPVLKDLSKTHFKISQPAEKILCWQRQSDLVLLVCLLNFNATSQTTAFSLPAGIPFRTLINSHPGPEVIAEQASPLVLLPFQVLLFEGTLS